MRFAATWNALTKCNSIFCYSSNIVFLIYGSRLQPIFKTNNIEGLRLAQDTSAKFMGDVVLDKLKIIPGPPKDRFLKIDNNGKITSLDKSGLLNAIYQPQLNCLSENARVRIRHAAGHVHESSQSRFQTNKKAKLYQTQNL